MGDRLWAGIPPRYVTKPTRSTQPCIPLGSLNRVPALIGWGNGGNVTSAGWQVILCDPIWHVSSRSGVVLVAQTAIRFLTLPYLHGLICSALGLCGWTAGEATQCELYIIELLRNGGLSAALEIDNLRLRLDLETRLPCA